MISKLTIKFIGGTHIDNAIRKATDIAKKYNCEVEFSFNGTIYSGGLKLIEKKRMLLEFVDVEKQ